MISLRNTIWSFVPVCLFVLAGCTVGPDYKAPTLDLPPSWQQKTPSNIENSTKPEKLEKTTGQTLNGTVWWRDFKDPAMTALIVRALANNQNLAVAAARISEVRGLQESAFGKLFPQIGGSAAAQKSMPGVSTNDVRVSTYQSTFDASWEIDLFGGVRREEEADDAATGASEAAYRDASLSLAAEVAREYILLRQFQAQLAVTRHTADIQKHLYDITADHYKGGLVSTLDVAQAETLYKSTTAKIPEFERQITVGSYRLSVLLGENPGSVDDIATHDAPIPLAKKIPVLDAPAEIIRRRPDVETAERNLAAATALQGAAISKLYPKISLAGLFGIQHADYDLFNYHISHQIWSFASSAAVPILNFGTIQGQINAADARQVQALHHYKQTVIEALANVETSLSNLSKEGQRDKALKAAGKSADHAVDIARERYRNGLTDFTTVLQAEQQRFAVQLDLIASKSTVAQDIIALHKALGDNPISAKLDD